MKTAKLLLALFTFAVSFYLSTEVKAQNGLSLSLQNYTVQPSNGIVSFGYTITISATLTNNDSSSFTGFVDFGLRNSLLELSNNSIFSKPFYSGDSIQLNGGESVPTLFSLQIDTPYFIAGPDVVVVWPISNVNFNDSVLINLLIEDPTSIEEQLIHKNDIQVFGDYILLPENNFKQVRIYNYSGSLLWEQNFAASLHIPIDFLPQGFYLLEAVSATKQRIVKKFVRWKIKLDNS